MLPVEYLKREHVLIAEFIDILDHMKYKLLTKQFVETKDLKFVVEFIKGFIDCIHHQKEELILYPVLADMEADEKDDVIKELMSEHDIVRGLLVYLEDRLDRSVFFIHHPKRVAYFIEDYIVKMKHHMYVEETGIFRFAEERLTAMENRDIWQKFEAFEEEITTERVEYFYTVINEYKTNYFIPSNPVGLV